jgi:glycosylphosphatidylinositol transamidase (GPIT) subunit GPI8
MTTDDFVNNSLNPWPGHLYDSQKKDLDLHKDVQIDYSGKCVTRENILSILMGDKERVKGGNGRVFQRYKTQSIAKQDKKYENHGSARFFCHIQKTPFSCQTENRVFSTHSFFAKFAIL